MGYIVNGGDGMNICFCIGHREASESILPMLEESVEHHITEYDMSEFVVGHYGAFDRLTASAIKIAKKRHPEVALTLLLPYHPFDRPISTPEGFDNTYSPPGMEAVPKRVAIIRANLYMVEHSTHLIAYL